MVIMSPPCVLTLASVVEVDEVDEVDEVEEVDEIDEVLLSDLIHLFLG